MFEILLAYFLYKFYMTSYKTLSMGHYQLGLFFSYAVNQLDLTDLV